MEVHVFSPVFLITMLVACFLLLNVLAAGGVPLLALAAERLAIRQRRVFLDKFGSQLSAMGVVLGLSTLPFVGWIWFMGWAGGWLRLYLKEPGMPLPEFSLLMAGAGRLLAAGVFLLALMLLVLYKATWKSLRTRKTVHSLLGLLAVVSSLAALFLTLAVKRMVMLHPGVPLAVQDMKTIFISLGEHGFNSPFWPLLGEAVGFCLAASAGLGLVYLILRRTKDDFGRDYYNYCLRHCASWAMAGGLVCLVMGGWLAALLHPQAFRLELAEPKVYLFLTGLFCLLLACASWGLVRDSETPLRHKPAIVLGALFLLLGLFGQTMSLMLTY